MNWTETVLTIAMLTNTPIPDVVDMSFAQLVAICSELPYLAHLSVPFTEPLPRPITDPQQAVAAMKAMMAGGA